MSCSSVVGEGCQAFLVGQVHTLGVVDTAWSWGVVPQLLGEGRHWDLFCQVQRWLDIVWSGVSFSLLV